MEGGSGMGELLGRRLFLTYGNCLKRVEEVVDLMKDDLCALGEAESIVLLLRKVRNLGPSLAELWRKLVVRDVKQLLSEMESIVASPEPNDREKMGYLSRKLFSLSRDAFYYGLNLNEEVVLKELFSSVRKPGEREGAVIPLNLLRGYTDPLAYVVSCIGALARRGQTRLKVSPIKGSSGRVARPVVLSFRLGWHTVHEPQRRAFLRASP
ncbi:hypothetical protein phiLo_65 [Thermus phage phiLo]|nr:hypothetical protein phiLo_65 [Thermus phage phiLo]